MSSEKIVVFIPSFFAATLLAYYQVDPHPMIPKIGLDIIKIILVFF